MRHPKVGSFTLALLLLGLTSCGGSDGPGTTEPEPPRATTITITQTTVTLSFLGATVALNASIRDQNGQVFSGTITWTSDNPSVVTVSPAGLLTAVQNGAATVSATSGSLSATVAVTVGQVATQLAIISGDGQSATVGQALAEAVVVRAEDAGGAAVAAVSLAVAVSSGGGTVGSSTAVTDAEGLASTTWTLGTTAGLQQIGVGITGTSFPPIQVSATGLAAAASELVKTSGDLQVGAVSFDLAAPIVVQLRDEFGNGVPNVEVTFTVTDGGGVANPVTAMTGADGAAQTIWTMGPAVGDAGLTATAAGFPPVEFTATAVPAQPDLVVGAISVSPVNPTTLQTVTVTVPVTNIGNLTTGVSFSVQLLVDGVEAATQTSDPIEPSVTTNVAFTAGPFASGVRALSVVVDPTGVITESDEGNNVTVQAVAVSAQTVLVAGTPIANVGAALGTELLFAFELPVEDGSIEFTLTSGANDDADMYVNRGERPLTRDDYECISGAADSNESCRFNAALTGTYHVLIHAFTTFSGATLSVTTGLEVLPYNIELVFINSGTDAQNAAFTSAAARWEGILPFDVHDIPFESQPLPANSCLEGQPEITEVIDDIRIYVDLIEIDGLGDTLGQASFCVFRSASGLPIVGFMQFDIADLASLETSGILTSVIVHEMGHVLGIGTTWQLQELLKNPSAGNPGADTHFPGPLAIAAFDAAGGTDYVGGKVPVENDGQEGSADGHWRESVLSNELMTPLLNSTSDPLSSITIQSLADVGYRVDVGQADPYSLPSSGRAPALRQGLVIDLRDDILMGPLVEVDEQGRIVRVIRR